MHLEKLIRQTAPFKSPYAKAEVGLIYLGNVIISQSHNYFKPYGITVQQYNVLRILRGQFPKYANINLIKERMLDKMCDASRIVERLHKQELILKQVNALDKRHTDVIITEKALALLKKIDEHQELQVNILNTLNLDEVNSLNQLISKVLGSLI